MSSAVTDGFELVVGLEVHVQLKTASKIFCGASTSFGDPVNSNTDPYTLGLPGVLPVLNAHVVELATRAALALGCVVHPVSIFARKHYFYPDLPKGYQISQFDRPLATHGRLPAGRAADGSPIMIGVTRAHLEEDAGKSIHDRYQGWSAIDLNRAGVPLIEIVSEPDIRSAQQAGAYLRGLKQILEYTDVSDANMEEGSLRVDVNISARPLGSTAFGTKTEIKNLNSFSAVERAIDVEFARQCAILRAGNRVEQQTLLWDQQRQTVRPARSKEGSHDYRYFPEPDLPPLVLDPEWIEAQRTALPELPVAKRERFIAQHGCSAAEAEQLVATQALAARFEALAAACGDSKRAATWMLGPVLAAVNARGIALHDYPVSIARLAAVIRLEIDGVVSNTAARQILAMLEEKDEDARAVAEREGLLKVSDDAALVGWIDEVLAENPAEAARYLGGERRLQGVLVGLVMKKSKGSADPKKVNALLAARGA
ncbi:MAG: Asp-tRNA(Asn)/Glu-tRNA(Gln) amidotransferase subunit GatB [Gemmatimonadaceae bacterium]|jgi:aspartyl-tRNA(Asn)/glutamyl-tRNA(Gln) amidotransferase subunit B|nr:Asp-tRNA(Asn)/Glu-tRNA(Gln) amidotransferase subunit GatB [Gemmatimonadaceae bacterium]